jgi:hypothetical protein
MNPSDLEKELRSLLPIAPSSQLGDRIAAELVETPAPVRRETEPAAGTLPRSVPGEFWVGWRWLVLPLAGLAAIAVLVITKSTTGSQHQLPVLQRAPAVLAGISETPDESVAEFIKATDEGVVYGENDEPQRQVRMVFLERHTWTNPQSGAVIEFEVPREDVVLMPVAME